MVDTLEPLVGEIPGEVLEKSLQNYNVAKEHSSDSCYVECDSPCYECDGCFLPCDDGA